MNKRTASLGLSPTKRASVPRGTLSITFDTFHSLTPTQGTHLTSFLLASLQLPPVTVVSLVTQNKDKHSDAPPFKATVTISPH